MSFDAESASALLCALTDPVICIDSHGTILCLNDAARSVFGESAAREGLSIRDLLPDAPPSLTDPTGPERVGVAVQTPEGRIVFEVAVARWRRHAETLVGLIMRRMNDATAAEALAARAEQALAEARLAQDRLRDIIEMLPQAVCVFDAQDRYVLWNHRYADLYPEIVDRLAPGVPFEDILRASMNSGEIREQVGDPEAWLAERLAKHALPSSQTEQELRDGCWLRHDDRRLADGGAIGMRIDITDFKRKEASLRMLFEDNPVPMMIFEPETLRIRAVNAAAVALYGFPTAEFLAKTAPELHLASEAAAARVTFSGITQRYDGRRIWRHRTAAGQDLHVLMFVRSVLHEGCQGLLTAVADVSDRVQAEAQVRHLAHHDALTGLANRFSFHKETEKALTDRPCGCDVVLYCLDLDGFKPVNDTFGHGGGDDLLRQVATRLRAWVRPGDLVARLGGDEFAILLTSPRETRPVKSADLPSRLIAAFRAPFEIEGQSVTIGLSIGYAVAPRDGLTGDSLLVAADTALYAAKRAGKNTWRGHGRRVS